MVLVGCIVISTVYVYIYTCRLTCIPLWVNKNNMVLYSISNAFHYLHSFKKYLNLDEIIKVEITFLHIYFKKTRFCFFVPANIDMVFSSFIKIT